MALIELELNEINDHVGDSMDFEVSGDVSDPQLPGIGQGVINPVTVKGVAVNSGDSIFVEATADAKVGLVCSRCLEDFQTRLSVPISCEYRKGEAVEESRPEEGRELSWYQGDSIDLSQEIRDQLLLEVPMKPLCDEECRGLCSQCGINLNRQGCECASDDIDDRLAPLKRLLKEGEQEE